MVVEEKEEVEEKEGDEWSWMRMCGCERRKEGRKKLLKEGREAGKEG